MNVTPMKKESDNPVDNSVQKPAPAAERQPFKVVENRYTPSNADGVLIEAESFLSSRESLDEPWLMTLRKQAAAQLEQRGLPTTRLERWKYARPSGLDRKLTGLSAKGKRDTNITKNDLPKALSPLRLVFVNSYFHADLSDMPQGLKICGAAHDFQSEEILQKLWNNAPMDSFNDQMQWALNSLYTSGGAIICVPKNMIVEQAIEVLYLSTEPHHFMPRTLIDIADNASATILEHYVEQAVGAQPQAINAAATINVGRNARLTHHQFNQFGADEMVLSTTHVKQARDSYYAAFTVNAGYEKMQRDQIWVQLQGENAECFLNGVQLSKGSQDHETVITMNHEAPNCVSNQDYRHIAADMSSCHFQGKVHVHQIAQKTEAFQMSRGVVLSQRAQVNTKPELEIYADDVKCSHGATTGQVDEQALFYMRSRGLSKSEAYKMLLTSFAADVFGVLGEDDDFAKSHIDTVSAWLNEVTK